MRYLSSNLKAFICRRDSKSFIAIWNVTARKASLEHPWPIKLWCNRPRYTCCMVPNLTASNKHLGIDPETGLPGSLKKRFLRSLCSRPCCCLFFRGVPWKWLLFLFQSPLGAVLPDLCAPRPATDRGPEAEEGKGSVQCACWLCARTEWERW